MADTTSIIDRLSDDDMDLPTVYRISVLELVRHLSGMEAYLAEVFTAHRSGDPGATLAVEHRALRDTTASPLRDEVVASWHRSSNALMSLLSMWSDHEAEAQVQIGELTMPGNAALIARAFELWTHGEDLCRATGQPFRIPSPAVIRSMAETAVDLLLPLLGQQRRHAGKTVRLTLTGPGGGSWVRRVASAGEDTTVAAAFDATDATLMADAVDFCRLVADRIEYEGGFEAHREGDVALLDEVVAVAPLLADFGAGPLPKL